MTERRRGLCSLLFATATAVIVVGCGPLFLGTSTRIPDTPTSAPATATALMPTETPPPSRTATRASPTATEEMPTATPLPDTATPTTTETSVPPSPTATRPRPSPTPTAGQAVIHTFEANVELADPGDTITLTWHWTGGEQAAIYHLMRTGQLSEPSWEVGQTGSVQYTIAPERRDHDTFVLFVSGEEGVQARATVQIRLRCPDEWFFTPAPDICPAVPATVGPGAEQHFERGLMLWVGPEERIYVLFDDGMGRRWSAYEDRWEEGMPTSDPGIEAPPGLEQPVRGFGLVWRENAQVREGLGWAIAEEQGYQTAMQRTSHVRYSDLYIRAADGGVWKLRPNGSSWEKVGAD